MGRVTLPRAFLDELGIAPKAEVIIETTATGIVIRQVQAWLPLTARIAAMHLPFADWPTLEREIEDEWLEYPSRLSSLSLCAC